MYEHVGVANYPEYFGAVRRALRPGGRFLNQGITTVRTAGEHIGGEFIYRFVFPGAELTDLGTVISRIEDAGLLVADVRDLRRDYALTLRAWERRYRDHRAEAAREVPERVLRTFDLYLPGCAVAFEAGEIACYQVLTSRAEDARTDPLPLAGAAPLP